VSKVILGGLNGSILIPVALQWVHADEAAFTQPYIDAIFNANVGLTAVVFPVSLANNL